MSSTVIRSGQLARSRRLDLAAALAQLGLDVREAEQLVDALLALGKRCTFVALDLGDPVLGDREAAPERPFAQLHVVLGRAGEVLEQVAEVLPGDDPQVDLDPGVGQGAGRRGARPRPASAISGCSARCSASAAGPRRSRSGRCPCRSRPSAAPSQRSRPGWRLGARAGPLPAPRRPGRTFESSRRSPAPPRRALQRGEDVLLGLRPEPFISRICSCSAASLSSVEVATPSSS